MKPSPSIPITGWFVATLWAACFWLLVGAGCVWLRVASQRAKVQAGLGGLVQVFSNLFTLGDNMTLTWTGHPNSNIDKDVGLQRKAAGVLGGGDELVHGRRRA